MPRQARIQYPGAMCHVMSRGNRRQTIYLDDVDRHDLRKPVNAKWGLGQKNRGHQKYCLLSRAIRSVNVFD
jgi:hypothetical protein